MIDVTGSLQIKNKIYQAVLSYKQDNKWKTKWVSTKVPAVKGNKKQAQAKLEEIRKQFQEEINSDHIDNEEILFIDYMKKWLKMIKASVEETTYNGYKGVVNGANMKEIQAWLGYTNYNTTANLYAHLDTSSVLSTGKVITNVFGTKKEVATAI